MSRDPFSLRFHPEGSPLRVLSFRGSEAASKLYEFDVTFAAQRTSALAARELLGRRGSIDIALADGMVRSIHGVIARISQLDESPSGEELAYRVRLVPKLWLLSRDRRSRVFQNATARDVIERVLGQNSVSIRWRASRPYAKRDYRIQYRESTLAFLERLMAEEDVFYWFTHAEGGEETMNVGDAPSDYDPVVGDPHLRFSNTGDMIAREHINRLAIRHDVGVEQVLLSGYDFRRPLYALKGSATSGARSGVSVHDHHGDLDEKTLDDAMAQRRLESECGTELRGDGESSCRRLAPCSWFELAEHPNPAIEGRYVVLEVEHRGALSHPGADGSKLETYKNTFHCVPAEMAWRPAPRDLPLQQVTETATVVGPIGEDIHTDAHGRVKVQFHWDLEGQRDEDSSCWLRCAQSWAGTAWGAQFIPRVGMEVIVTFIGGDVDRPIITGAVYNGLNPPPFSLPEHKTQSGIRTKSTPSGGFNEIRFEDATGREHIYVHAERNLEQEVENDHVRTVRGAERLSVARDRTVDIDGDHIRSVQGSEVISVHKHLVMNIAGRQVIHVGGAHFEDDTLGSAVATATSAEGVPGAGTATSMNLQAGSFIPTATGLSEDALRRRGAPTLPSLDSILKRDEQTSRIAHARLRWMTEQLAGADYAHAERWMSALRSCRAQLERALADLTMQGDALDQGHIMTQSLERLSAVTNELDALGSNLEGQGSPNIRPVANEAAQQQQQLRREVDIVHTALTSGLSHGSEDGEAGGDPEVEGWKPHKVSGSMLNIKGGGAIHSMDGLELMVDGAQLGMAGGNISLSAAASITLSAPKIIISGGTVEVKGAPIKLN